MDISAIKLSEDKKRKYFNFSIQNDKTLLRCGCFSPKRNQLFSDFAYDNAISGTEIKRFSSSNSNNNIIVNEFTSVKKKKLILKENASEQLYNRRSY